MSNSSNKNNKTDVNAVASVNGKTNIKKIHEELGFGEFSADEFQSRGSILDIDAALKKELNDFDLVHRFINFKKYKEAGFHKAKWVPYKRKSQASGGAIYTVDPDGYTVKQDLVLAVRPKAMNDAHRKHLRSKAAKLESYDKEQAQSLRDSLKESGYKNAVTEGFED